MELWVWLAIILVVSTIWFEVCSFRTLRERLRLIEARHGRMMTEEWRRLCAEFESVSYDDHLWRRICLRNPWALYGAATQELMRPRRGG